MVPPLPERSEALTEVEGPSAAEGSPSTTASHLAFGRCSASAQGGDWQSGVGVGVGETAAISEAFSFIADASEQPRAGTAWREFRYCHSGRARQASCAMLPVAPRPDARRVEAKEHNRMPVTEFRERVERTPLDATVLALLPRRISDLQLRIAGTALERLIAQLYRDLEARGIRFRPKCYLADEWGCPTGVPVIGIPFYLADPQLARIEGELTGIEAETEVETLMYLRHESGHAFNYAYRLYLDGEWTRTFGSFRRPYPDEYRPEPFSDRYVRHIPGWYAIA